MLDVNRSDQFVDILRSAQASLFTDSPSRLVPYMNHRGFTAEEIECISLLAEKDPDSLASIIASDDLASLASAAARLSGISGIDGPLCASLMDDLRKASDLYFGRPHVMGSIFETKSTKAVDGRDGTLISKEFVFSFVKGGVALDKYTGTRSCVVVPDSVICDGSVHSVVRISGWAFGRMAFVTSVVLPYTLVSIGERAFSDCSELTSLGIPSVVSEISADAFDGCDSLRLFDVDPGNPRYASDSQGILYDKKERALFIAPPSISGVVVVPDRVVAIGDSAFCGCSGLKGVVARGGLETIGSWAFEGCDSLESITLGSSLVSIGRGAFYGCSSLRSFDAPDGLRSIESRAFSGC